MLSFGSYCAGASPLHTMNAQVKIVLTCVFSVSVFFIDSWIGAGAASALVVISYAMAHVPLSRALAGLKPLLFILLVTVLVHAVDFGALASAVVSGLSTGSMDLQAIAGSASFEGFLAGLFIALRIALLVSGCALLTFTTPQLSLTGGFRALVSPLRKLHVPVDDIALVMSLALRFVPNTIDEALHVQRAQAARGANFSTGGVARRIRAWVPVFIPLFVRLFRQTDTLAEALDARCYRSVGATPRANQRPAPRDLAVLTLGFILLVVLAVLW